jgi:hypothetical protein
MTDAEKAAREAGIREAAEVVDGSSFMSMGYRDGILALLNSTPAPAGVTVPDELYQAAKRDAEDAEAYAAELEAKLAKAVEAAIDTCASLAAAISLLDRGGKKAAPSNKMFDQMMADYRASLERTRTTLTELDQKP